MICFTSRQCTALMAFFCLLAFIAFLLAYSQSIKAHTYIYKALFPCYFMALQSRRIHRVNYVLSMLQAAYEKGKVWNEEVLISEVCMKFGAGRRSILEYLRDLENTKRIVRDIGEVFLPEQYKKIKAQSSSTFQIEQEADEILNDLGVNNKNQKGVKKSGN